MSDDIRFEASPACPHCGANLQVEQLGVEPDLNDQVFCSTCSFECSRETFLEKHFKIDAPEIQNRIGEEVDKLIGGMLKGFGFKPD